MGFRLVKKLLAGTMQQRMIRHHSRWLGLALRGRKQAPRIPTRRVDEGGYARLMSTQQGRAVADEWWQQALKRTSR